MSKRFFVNNLDTRFGEALMKQLVKEVPEEPVHMCTLRDQSLAKPKGIKKVLKREKPKLSKKKMLEEADVYIYSIQDTDQYDIQFGLSIFDKPIEEQKVFILVSDITAWSASPRKIKPEPKPEPVEVPQGDADPEKNAQQVADNKQGSNPDEDRDRSVSGSPQPRDASQKDEQPEEEVKPIEYTFYEDKDYQSRVPLPQYEFIKRIEDRVLTLKKDNIRTFVVCPGLTYGQGEFLLYELFKTAWLQEPKELPYCQEGSNLIPTIHISDLAKFVIKLAEAPAEDLCPYLLAFDNSKDRTQKCLIESISKGVGSGLVKSVGRDSPYFQNGGALSLNIDIVPSKFLVGTPEQPSGFEWTCEFGLEKGTRRVLQEFCDKHRLRPFNIVSITPDHERRQKDSKYEEILGDMHKQYRTPILKIQNILFQAKSQAPPQLKIDLEEEYMNIVNYLAEKKSRPLDETLKVLYRVVKWRLSQNDCLCRGYILDSFPRFQEQAKHIFVPVSATKLKRKVKKIEVPKPKLDGDADADGDAPPADAEPDNEPQDADADAPDGDQEKPKKQRFFPESLIKFKRLSLNEQRFSSEVNDWLSEQGIEQLVYDWHGKKKIEIFQSLRSYIERNGRPDNYLVKQQDLIQQHKDYYQKLNDTLTQEKVSQKKKEQALKKQQVKHRESLAESVFNQLHNQGETDINKMPFRNYLMEFVVPILNEGLLEVSNIIPNDPVELLAEYLYQKSYDV